MKAISNRSFYSRGKTQSKYNGELRSKELKKIQFPDYYSAVIFGNLYW